MYVHLLSLISFRATLELFVHMPYCFLQDFKPFKLKAEKPSHLPLMLSSSSPEHLVSALHVEGPQECLLK